MHTERLMQIPEVMARLGLTDENHVRDLIWAGQVSCKISSQHSSRWVVVENRKFLELEKILWDQREARPGKEAPQPIEDSRIEVSRPKSDGRLPLYRNRGIRTKQSITSCWFVDPETNLLLEFPDQPIRSSF